MVLATGSQVGPYEILSALGAGGMGEVFRARDTRLNRDVAIKVLPAAFAQDKERVARFRREAQVVASLNHPNIAAIYGIEESDGVVGLALELVEGEDLAQRLTRGAIPVDEAIDIARQIAEGLEAAHEKGIVHRDLKPANVKVTSDGTVKILDFGLAKAYEGDPASGDAGLENSPTMARPMTDAGIILGTAAYMSPEQARGKVVDKRADIWSFGVLLYEMLTARRLFAGDTVSDTLAAVLRQSVSLDGLPEDAPPAIRHVLVRCLERDPRKRLRDIGEVRVALSDPAGSVSLFLESATPVGSAARRRALNLGLTILAIAGAALFGAWSWSRLHPTPAPVVTRFSIEMAPGEILAGNSGPAISRDGRRIGYVVRDANGVSRLHLRALDRFESTVVPESASAQQPFFSPDGTKIGFFASGKLMVAPVAGGAPVSLADASYQTFGGTWGDDGTIVYVPTLMSGLMRVPAAGGKPESLTAPDGAVNGYAHVYPQFLSGEDQVLFTLWGGQNQMLRALGLMDLQSKSWTRAPARIAYSQFSHARSGHVLTSGTRGVSAVRFDPARPRVDAEHTLVVDDVFATVNISLSWYAVADNGTLAYVPGNPSLGTLAWVDRAGNVTPLSEKPGTFVDPSLSPDGTRIVVGQNSALWAMELRRGTLTRLTLDAEGFNMVQSWSPDGSRVFFASNRGGDWDLYSVRARGGVATRVLARKGIQMPLTTAPDGTLLFAERSKGTGSDFFLLTPSGEVKPFLISPFSKVGAQFSPDGRAVAYSSDETGRDEIYVCSVARPDEVAAVSTEGGFSARWSPDGKELFYRRGDSLVAVNVDTSPDAIEVGETRKLFDLRIANARSPQHPGYAVSPDGSRFLVVIPEPQAIPTRINIVLNWFEELNAKVPPR